MTSTGAAPPPVSKARRARGTQPAAQRQNERRADADAVAERIWAHTETDGMTWRDITEAMGIKPEAVRARYNRARKTGQQRGRHRLPRAA